MIVFFTYRNNWSEVKRNECPGRVIGLQGNLCKVGE